MRKEVEIERERIETMPEWAPEPIREPQPQKERELVPAGAPEKE